MELIDNYSGWIIGGTLVLLIFGIGVCTASVFTSILANELDD